MKNERVEIRIKLKGVSRLIYSFIPKGLADFEGNRVYGFEDEGKIIVLTNEQTDQVKNIQKGRLEKMKQRFKK